jgi:predicted phage terminase large subunit-like protein
MTVTKEQLKNIAIALARVNFYSFCRVLYPRFYKPSRLYLKTLCDNLQDFYENKLLDSQNRPYRKLMILMPPRHGKSYTVANFCKWMLGKDNSNSIIAVSYGQDLSMKTGKEVRNSIQAKSIAGGDITYADIFPNTKIKDGDGAADSWSLEGSHFNFLSTSPTATITGAGCKYIIIDDLTKNADEANNEFQLDKLWSFYTDTALSRIESGGKQLIINTRWCDKDISGKLLSLEADEWHVIKMPACIDELSKEMLAPDLLSFEEYQKRKTLTNPLIFSANYQQDILQAKDRLYSDFKTYSKLPEGITRVHAYCDTADQGKDALCCIVYGLINNNAYVLDVLHTTEAMETTEPAVASLLNKYNAETAFIESNNGGRGFARNVETRIRAAGNHKTRIDAFTQTGNKVSRILTNSFSCTNSIIMPEGWTFAWPTFYRELMSYSRTGKNAQDDAPDALTGVVEKSLSKADFFFL